MIESQRQFVWTSLLDYLETVPLPDDYRKAHNLADISLVIERDYIQTELRKYDDAAKLFLEHLEKIVFLSRYCESTNCRATATFIS